MNLEAARKDLGFGIIEAARRIGVSYSSLKLAEAGVEPRSDVAKKIADFYGVRVTDLWPVDQDPEPRAA